MAKSGAKRKKTKSSAARGGGPYLVPAVGKPRPVRLPTVADETLPNGLRVLVARRPGIPRFEARLVVPTARGGAGDAARLRVLSETILSGTPRSSSLEIAEELQGMGGGLGSYADAEQLIVAGSSLSLNRSRFVSLFGEVVQEASFPAGEVSIERERIVQEIALLRSQPGVIAGDALVARLYGSHPYGRGTPDPEAVARVQPGVLRRLHAARVRPGGSLLVLAGDLDLDVTMADVTAAFGGWEAGGAHGDLPAPTVSTPPTLLVVDRPAAVQTNVRLGGAAIPRTDPEYPALALAVTVYSGYFTSRLNDNIREQKGYTYGAHSRIEHRRMAAQISISADVGREVTAASLVEITYELGRMVSLPVAQAELDAARRYLQGTLAMGIQTQSGLTSHLASLVSAGLPVSYLRDYPAALEDVTTTDVLAAAQRHLGPAQLTTVLVGDAATVVPAVEPLGTVEVG
jgi:predicted Zn-dependent peptidase